MSETQVRPDEITAPEQEADEKLPVELMRKYKELSSKVRQKIEDVCKELGEHHIGGSRHPTGLAFHRVDKIDARAAQLTADTQPKDSKQVREVDCGREDLLLKDRLRCWATEYVDYGGRVLTLLVLWEQAYEVMLNTLAFHSLGVVKRAAEDFVREEVGEVEAGSVKDSEGNKSEANDPEEAAMKAVRNAMQLIVNDLELFKLMNMSDAAGLIDKAQKCSDTAADIAKEFDKEVLGATWANACKGIKRTAEDLSKFYAAGKLAAQAVDEFEKWLRKVPVMDAPNGGESLAATAEMSSVRTVVEKVDEAKGKIDSIKEDLTPKIRELCDPWEQVLIGIRSIIASKNSRVFVPQLVKLRYCYPFAVDLEKDNPPWGSTAQTEEPDEDEKERSKQKNRREKEKERAETERERKQREKRDDKAQQDFLNKLKAVLGKVNINVGECDDLGTSQFFYREDNIYGGLKIGLGEIRIDDLSLPVIDEDTGSELKDPDKAARYQSLPAIDDETGAPLERPDSVTCKVWLELSNMGNHCLRIQAPTLKRPWPHELYRAVRAGTPFSLGQTVSVCDPCDATQGVRWDSLHMFSRDVLVAVGVALLDVDADTDEFRRHFEAGNLKEVVVAQTYPTSNPRPRSEAQPKPIAAALDDAVGGKIVLRSTHQAAGALAEWVRYPRLCKRDLDLIEDTPVMGMEGDWFADTGEMTAFGFVAAPGWHTEVYAEAAQFANSWSPLLRLWGRLLQDRIQSAKPGPKAEGDNPAARNSLRRIEKRVRLHLMQIKAEDLCATRAHRAFLDQLLDMARLDRTQKELEVQLTATEHLSDWYDSLARQQSESRRNILLFALTLMGIFGLSGFLGDLNKEPGEKILWLVPMKAHLGMWEDNVVVLAFLIFVGLSLYFDLLGHLGWRDRVRKSRQRLGRTVGEFFRKVRQRFAISRKNEAANPNPGGRSSQ